MSQGNGPESPRFGSPVSSMNGCQMEKMDPNGYEASSTYTVVEDMVRYGNNGRKMNDVTERKWKQVFWGSPSQCIYRIVQGFLTHGILLSMVFINGFLPILIFRVFVLFGESGNKSQ